jgi:hypothetical protein
MMTGVVDFGGSRNDAVRTKIGTVEVPLLIVSSHVVHTPSMSTPSFVWNRTTAAVTWMLSGNFLDEEEIE